MNFDSTILIDLLCGVGAARDEFERHDEHFVSVVARAEVLVGAEAKEQVELAKQLFRHCRFVDVDVEIADAAAAIRRRSGAKLPDAIIAATAQVLGQPLVTRDEKLAALGDFVQIPYRLD